MFDIHALNKYDISGMYKIYDKWPEIARRSYESEQDLIDFKNIDHIVFAGMGGSGALGDIFSSILSKSNIHVAVVKGYHLPNTIDVNTLVVTTSISGNTIETLSILDSAKRVDCKIIAFSSDGIMKNYCMKNKIPHRIIPLIHSPRASFTEFLYSMLKVLGPNIPIKEADVMESIYELKKMGEKISSQNWDDKNPALNLAKWITGIPLIYYPFGLQAAAIRFKNSLQENSKIHAIAEDVVEASHNGIVSWERSSTVQPILIEGKDDYVKTKERWQILKEYFEQKNIDYKEIHSVEGNILSKLITLIYLLDYSTIYLATLFRVDPSPVGSIDFIKERLSPFE